MLGKNIYQKTKIKPPETGHVTKTKKINRNSGSGVSAGDDGDDEGVFFFPVIFFFQSCLSLQLIPPPLPSLDDKPSGDVFTAGLLLPLSLWNSG